MPDATSDGRRAKGRLRGRVRGALLLAIGGLYGLSIPWYRGGDEPAMVFGLPDWVAVAVGCYVAVAILNAVAWLLTDVPEAPEGSRPDDEAGR